MKHIIGFAVATVFLCTYSYGMAFYGAAVESGDVNLLAKILIVAGKTETSPQYVNALKDPAMKGKTKELSEAYANAKIALGGGEKLSPALVEKAQKNPKGAYFDIVAGTGGKGATALNAIDKSGALASQVEKKLREALGL